MAWSPSQCRTFAKEIIEQDLQRGRACAYLTARMRTALVEAHCFNVIRAQAAETVRVADMDALLAGVIVALEEKLGHHFFD